MEAFNDSDLHFQKFTKILKQKIDKESVPQENSDDRVRLRIQKEDIEALVDLEKKIKELLIASPFGQEFYEEFIDFICDTEKNILLARPYFRERQTAFYKGISNCFKKREWSELTQYHFNFLFISFFEQPINKWEKIPDILPLIKKIKDLRQRIAQKLMPLAISRARIFWARTPESHLSFMDLLQISAEGLIAAIDKYCLPFTRVFRSVCIGRITGNFIADYSETFIHFYPVDRRKIYRANKINKRLGNSDETDYEALAVAVNKAQDGKILPKEQRTNAAEICSLLAASSCVSTDMTYDAGGDDSTEESGSVDQYSSPLDEGPDILAEKEEALSKLAENSQKLSILEKKLLIMEGLLSYDSV